MRAIVLDRYGPPERVMRLAELADPVPAVGEVTVRVAAVSLNSWDVDLATGATLIRLESPFRPKRRVIGSDVSGTVIAVGPGVTRHRVGDAVFGELSAAGWGGFAERVVARADAFTARPAGLDDLTAAALPQAASMAWQALGGAEAVVPGGPPPLPAIRFCHAPASGSSTIGRPVRRENGPDSRNPAPGGDGIVMWIQV